MKPMCRCSVHCSNNCEAGCPCPDPKGPCPCWCHEKERERRQTVGERREADDYARRARVNPATGWSNYPDGGSPAFDEEQ